MKGHRQLLSRLCCECERIYGDGVSTLAISLFLAFLLLLAPIFWLYRLVFYATLLAAPPVYQAKVANVQCDTGCARRRSQSSACLLLRYEGGVV